MPRPSAPSYQARFKSSSKHASKSGGRFGDKPGKPGKFAKSGAGGAGKPGKPGRPDRSEKSARSERPFNKPFAARRPARPARPTFGRKERLEAEERQAQAAGPVAAPAVRKVTVGENDRGQRIDNFLIRQLGGVPKSAIYRIVRKGEVRVNGGRVKAERKLELGDEVRIPPVRVAPRGEAVRPPDPVLNKLREAVIYEDDLYLAINKPAGFASHGGTGVPYGVIEAVRAWAKYEFIELCHRLDRDTSGVLLLAKTRPGLLRAQRAFKNSLADKRYFALVVGKWRGEDRDVDAALVRSRIKGGERYVEVDEEDGKPSKSRFSPKARYSDYSLMEVTIFSGRTHQIRVHALALGHAVAGDEKYGEREVNQKLRRHGLRRMFLHSHYLELTSEAELPKVIISAPMPDELRSFMTKLGPGR